MSIASSFVCSPVASASSGCLLPPSKHCGAPSMGKLQGRRLSCRAAATSGSGGDENLVRRNIDRRDVLFGLTGFAAVSTTNLGLGLAAEPAHVPITAEVLKCSTDDKFLHCPIEYDTRRVVDFSSLPPPSGPPRVRRPAHMLEDEYVKKFEEAIRRMKELGDDDPRSYKNQADIHEAYCANHYKVVSSASPEVNFDVHFSSIFAPWHRMYILFFERILGDLIGDPTFGLPYWNWDAPEGMVMPSIFANDCSPLYDANRKPQNVRAFMDLNAGPAKQDGLPEPGCTDEFFCRMENNLYAMYRQMTADTPVEFHGDTFASGKKSAGTLEMGAHTAAHIWVGGDMGDLSTAGRDPVFYCNHSNVDRMWHLRRTMLNQPDHTSQEWLDTSFIFYDETKYPVRITVKDVLDVGKLGYTYEEKKRLEWMDRRPKPSTAIKRPFNGAQRSITPASSFPVALRKGQNEYVTAERPEKAQASGGSTKNAPEVLVLDLTIDPCEYGKFDVLVNVPRGQEDKVGPKDSEYAGSFTHVPHGGNGGRMRMETMDVSYRLKLREIIDDLKCGRDKRLDFTIVPVAGEKTIVKGARIDIL